MLHLSRPSSMHHQPVSYYEESQSSYSSTSSRRPSYYHKPSFSNYSMSGGSNSNAIQSNNSSRPLVDESARIVPISSEFSTPIYSSTRPGLRTPPPERSMNADDLHNALVPYASNGAHRSNDHANRGHIRQFEPATHSSMVPNMLDSFRSYGNDGKRKRVSPPSRRGSFAQQMKEESRSRRSSTVSTVSMIIPSTINSSGGSLADFAAQITCFFWFETSTVLRKVTESEHSPLPTTPVISDALPTMGFRKWATTILATTQVSQNVIILALLFIYRLKMLNPTVKGKAGSEFRLFTVALMLGNKFLDDNTYTNKTWAEVSGITVGEIHVMEVEFLSNMRYSLYTSEAQWLDWHKNLGKFGEYWDRAERLKYDLMQRNNSTIAMLPMSGLSNVMNSVPLPSPPPSNSASPPFYTAQSPGTVLPPPLALTSYPTSVSPKLQAASYQQEFVNSSRKRDRGYEDNFMQPPTKRMSISGPSRLAPQLPITLNIPAPALVPNPYGVSRMPVSSTTHGSTSQCTTPTSIQPQHNNHFFPTSRAMSTVFPAPAPNNWHTSHGNATTPLTHTMNVSPFSQSRHSPYTINSNNSSPSMVYSNNHSPSIFLTQRDSPYRPVRHVSTLLAPPLNAEPQHLGYDQMQYQPLAKSRASNYRTGTVPYTQDQPWASSNTAWNMQPTYQS